MSINTSAHISFGINLGEEIPNWLTKLAKNHIKYDDDDDEYFDLGDALKGSGLELIIYGCDSYLYYILALEGTEKTANLGDTCKINPLDISEKQVETWNRLVTPCCKVKPAWLLYALRI